MDSFTATIPTKQEDIVLPPVNEDGGGGSSGSCIVCKEDTSLPPMNEDGGAHPTPASSHGHSSSATSIEFTRLRTIILLFDFYTIRALLYMYTHKQFKLQTLIQIEFLSPGGEVFNAQLFYSVL
ncbi:hypothetical protein C8R45DRAFT_1106828 [Mycena sanguinolenta]|nr:hypothetical protein C8R45DRAFT_1106828 [Mycena sanguinolenta]